MEQYPSSCIRLSSNTVVLFINRVKLPITAHKSTFTIHIWGLQNYIYNILFESYCLDCDVSSKYLQIPRLRLFPGKMYA